MDPIVQSFININNPTCLFNLDTGNLFLTLVNNLDSDGVAELQYVTEHPEILVKKIKHHLVFDYFYEKVLNERYHPVNADQWQDILLKIIKLANSVSEPDIIKGNKKYIMKLQSTSKTMMKLFGAFVDDDYDMGDPEFLVYSIIARGELDKLQLLSNNYVIEDYPAVLDMALMYGRHDIIRYFIDTLKLDIKYYGKIVDFENYKDNPRYLFYREHIVQDSSFRNKSIVGASKQDYVTALKLVLEQYDYPVTCITLEKWCELIRNKEYVWDHIKADEILQILLDRIAGNLPLAKDFRFGKEWSDRACLVEHCLNLEKRLEELNERHTVVLNKFRHLQNRTK
jgi:hypothetical protein